MELQVPTDEQPLAARLLQSAVDGSPRLELAILSIHYIYPALVFISYVVASTYAVCTLQAASPRDRQVRRKIVISLLGVVLVTYLSQLLATLIRSAVARHWLGPQDNVIFAVACLLTFGVLFSGLLEAETPIWYPHLISWCLALVFEPITMAVSYVGRPPDGLGSYEYLDIAIVAVRYASFIAILATYLVPRAGKEAPPRDDCERQPLIHKNGTVPDNSENGESSGASSTYGSTSDNSTDASQSPTASNVESPYERREREAKEKMAKRLEDEGSWFTYAKGFIIFLPYVWPVDNKSLQVRVLLVGICLLAGNALNVLIPRQLGIVLDSLNGEKGQNPWAQVLVFGALKLAASEAGISFIRQWLWIPVNSYSMEAISSAAYSHILNLSADFHDSKSSSDLVMAIYRGHSVSNMLDTICFYALPRIIDLGVAFIYLSITFGALEGLITVSTTVVFLYVTTRMIQRLQATRKKEISAYFEEHYARQSGIQGWYTVSAFGRTSYEEGKYTSVLKKQISLSQITTFGYLINYAVQYGVSLAGLMASAFLAVYQVRTGKATPGQFAMLLTYWAQLISPLNFFANLGKSVTQDLMNAERLLDIMQTKPSVVNKDGALPLKLKGGHVKFDGVDFSYDRKKEILKGITFEVPSGTSVAFVGTTGAGKSTILKLLDRFYDVTGGSIRIDDQDIRDIDLLSLRQQLGVVPQNPILFDDTIINNVRYAKLNATDEEVYAACQAASIHEAILGFTDGYQTRIGERGVKISGGEIQRLAVARAILKDPAVVLLDEATSAVDTDTEQKIQDGLRSLCKGRTTFIVAHRLSTIMNADRIIVVDHGQVIEQGSHEDLIRAKGKYADLWSKQIFIKPKANDSGGEAKPNGKTNIVNDLTPEVTTSERAKVQPGKPGSDPAAQGSKGDKDQPAAQTPAAHKKEGSKLNPGAPEFTPRGSYVPIYDPSGTPTPVTPMQHAQSEFLSARVPPACTPMARAAMSSESTDETAYSGQTLENTSAGSQMPTSDTGRCSPAKQTQYARRFESKSEPAGESSGSHNY